MIIRNGLVALSGKDDFERLDIKVKDGIIVDIAKNINADGEIIDAEGCFVFPGAIDPHVHFNDPGNTHRESFYTGTCAAAAGGITTIIDMPCTSVPPVTSKENLFTKLNAVKESAVVDYGFYGGISGQTFPDAEKLIKELAEYVPGYKVYTISGMKSFESLSYEQIKEVVKLAGKYNKPVLVHSEDRSTVNKLTSENMKKGNSPVDFYNSRPEEAETESAKKLRKIAKKTNGNLHIVHVGSAEVLNIISDCSITCETAPHYLAFDVNDFREKGSALKITPPVKGPQNKAKLWEYLNNGKISFAATDHAPSTITEKNTGSVWTDYSGIPGCETLIPYLFSEGLMTKRLSLSRYLQITSENAAKKYGFFDRKGSIEIGKEADFTIINPKEKTEICGKNFFSKGKITPFEGMKFSGKLTHCIVRGKTVFQNKLGILAPPGYGNFIK